MHEYRNLYEIEGERVESRCRQRTGDKQGRHGCHRDSRYGQCRGDSDIDRRGCSKQETRPRIPQAAALTNRIDGRLATEDQDNERERLECPGSEVEAELTHGQDARAEGQQAATQ
jgi:hypothetical protein